MTASHPISKMSPPMPGEKVPRANLTYFKARNRGRLFDFLTRKFQESGITRAELAIRTGRSTEQISCLLGQPGNPTADTMAELLFAMCGEEIHYSSMPLPPPFESHRFIHPFGAFPRVCGKCGLFENDPRMGGFNAPCGGREPT